MGGAPEDVWDVVVVGAGPAGANAAYEAASAGARTLLVERNELPRYKTCGGGLIGMSLAALPPGFVPPYRQQVQAAAFSMAGRATRTVRSADPELLGLVNRDSFDAALVKCARAAGAQLQTGVVVTDVTEDSPVVTLATRGGPLRARVVIGADGSASRIGRYVGVECPQVDLGLEVELPLPDAQRERWSDRLLVDFGDLPGSYGWVFPKGGTLTVGVIAARDRGAAARSYLAEFVARLGLDGIEPLVSSGHLTRCRAPSSPLRRGRVLVAGDAAGLLEPWTREGISYALRSGRLAGQLAGRAVTAAPAAVEQALDGYPRGVAATLEPEMAAGRVLLDAFSRRPGLFHRSLAAGGPARRTFERFARRSRSPMPSLVRALPVRVVFRLLGVRPATAVPRPPSTGTSGTAGRRRPAGSP